MRALAGTALALLLALSACARVRPHARERLADPAMQAPAWPTIDRADTHTREISEGSQGATAAGGGGCGCN